MLDLFSFLSESVDVGWICWLEGHGQRWGDLGEIDELDD